MADRRFSSSSNTRFKPPNDGRCRICRELGHFARDCPRRDQQQSSMQPTNRFYVRSASFAFPVFDSSFVAGNSSSSAGSRYSKQKLEQTKQSEAYMSELPSGRVVVDCAAVVCRVGGTHGGGLHAAFGCGFVQCGMDLRCC